MSLCESICKAGPRGSRAGPFYNEFTFCPVSGVGTRPARVKEVLLFRGAGHAAPHSSLQPSGSDVAQLCGAGPRGFQKREGLESRGKSSVGRGW